VLTSRREFYDYLNQPGLTDIQRAARWFFRNKNSFGGMMKHFGTSKTTGASSIKNRLAAIEFLSDRLDKVLIENLDWRECLSRYDAKATHFFLDPPYFGGYQYASPWKLDDHIDLRDYLFAIEGSWTLTYDDHPEVRKLYQGCQLLEVNQRRGIGNNHANLRKDFPQLIITKAA
jgi:DNA adenine methylase